MECFQISASFIDTSELCFRIYMKNSPEIFRSMTYKCDVRDSSVRRRDYLVCHDIMLITNDFCNKCCKPTFTVTFQIHSSRFGRGQLEIYIRVTCLRWKPVFVHLLFMCQSVDFCADRLCGKFCTFLEFYIFTSYWLHLF